MNCVQLILLLFINSITINNVKAGLSSMMGSLVYKI